LLNFILIPHFSLYGAAFATLITYFVMFVLMYFYIRKEFFNFRIRLICPLLSSVVMGVLLSQLLFLNLFWIILLSSVVYFVVLFLLSKSSFINGSVLKK
jgi:O-antigen/teichoic acid export membrane protein